MGEKRIVKILSDIYDEDEEGEEVLIKKNVQSNCLLDVDDITGVFEVLNKKGTVYKTKCQIHHKDWGNVLIKHRFKEVNEWISPKNRRIGFK